MRDRAETARRLVLTTACVAVVEEVWTLDVPSAVAANALDSSSEALALLQSEYVVAVENAEIRDEQDRVLLSVELAEGTTGSPQHKATAGRTSVSASAL